MNKVPHQLLKICEGSALMWVAFIALSFFGLALVWLVPEESAIELIRYCGAAFLMLVIFAWVIYLLCSTRPFIGSARNLSPGKAIPALLSVGAGAWLLFAQADFGPKILMDEYLLASTARNIHEYGEVCITTRVVATGENYRPSETSVDKRPWLYPLVVSLLHDVRGYSEANLYVLNAGLALCLLGMAFYQGCIFAGTAGGLTSVLLWASLPLLAQAATGAGMDLINLCLIQCACLAAAAYLRESSPVREALLVLTGVLLAYARYESILFLGVIVLVLAIGMWRARRSKLTWTSALLPLLLTPLALHLKAQFGQTDHYEMASGVVSPFALTHLQAHLPHALAFFFNTGHDLANSLWFSVLGSVAFVALLVGLHRNWKRYWQNADHLVLLLFILALCVHLLLLLSYHAGQFTDLFASRFALPFHFTWLAAVLLAFSNARPGRFRPWPSLSVLTLLFVVSYTLPMNAKAIFSERSFIVREQAWLSELREQQLESDSLIIDRFTIGWALRDWVALRPQDALLSRDLIRENLENGTHTAAYYVERTVYSKRDFRPDVPGLEKMHERFSTDLIEERSFRPLTKTRIYRLSFPEEAARTEE